MAWGAAASRGVDDLAARLRANDPRLITLAVLKQRRLRDDVREPHRCCDAAMHHTWLLLGGDDDTRAALPPLLLHRCRTWNCLQLL